MSNFKSLSRYKSGKVATNRTNKNFLALRRSLNLKFGDDDIIIEITQEYIRRPDLISSKVYGTPELWWVIYEMNNISDPLFDLRIGQLLRIPNLQRVLEAIQNVEE